MIFCAKLVNMRDYKKDFPLIKLKKPGLKKKFDLADYKGRLQYYKAKAGPEINLLKKYFKKSTFIAYFLGKKNAGKGTYTKLIMDIFGSGKIGHISVGDVVRKAEQELKNQRSKKQLLDYLGKNYRGYISIDQAINALANRTTKGLLPTELIITLIKREIDGQEKKTLFIDGLPRELDQVSYALFFRDLINYREDQDLFINIDLPESVIEARMKNRVICPKCHTPRNPKLHPTKKVGYDKNKKEFYLICDNPQCENVRMVGKEGDELGLEAIRERLNKDQKLMDVIFSLHGIPKILLQNSIPVETAKQYVDDYEITPEYYYQWDEKSKKVKTLEKPWVVKDDQDRKVYSLLASPVAVTLIKQLVKVLGLR
ncbi:MAG: nucleoside monophosphate kinase [Patescibacteria group bacterium]